MTTVLAGDLKEGQELRERLETVQDNFNTIIFGDGPRPIVSGSSVQVNSAAGTLIINSASQNGAPQNSLETLTVNRGEPDHLGRPFLGLFLEVDQRVGILKGDGVIRLKGHTLTVVEDLQEFTGTFVGPGEVRYPCATLMAADQTYEVREGVLQLSGPLEGSARRLSR